MSNQIPAHQNGVGLLAGSAIHKMVEPYRFCSAPIQYLRENRFYIAEDILRGGNERMEVHTWSAPVAEASEYFPKAVRRRLWPSVPITLQHVTRE
jgi:hypothetical protein